MKNIFYSLMMLGVVVMLTGCETARYAFNQTFGDQREFGTFQSKPAHDHPPDLLLANADDWVKEHLW